MQDSVGRGGCNLAADVRAVQMALTAQGDPLRVDGLCGRLTIAAIAHFQVSRRLLSDGIVFPGGPTARALGLWRAPHVPPEVMAAACASEARWGVPAPVTLAQWALESAWGTRMPPDSNNPFGIKARPGEPAVTCATEEVTNGVAHRVVQDFRAFPTIEAAFDAHGRLLATCLPYREAMAAAPDPERFARALTGRYATAPDYGEKLVALMRAAGFVARASSGAPEEATAAAA